MAIAHVTITCSICGCTFTHRATKHTRSEADSYEAWAIANITTCPDCHRKQQTDSAAIKVADELAALGIALPKVSGVSDKQVAYAESVRTRYLATNIKRIKNWQIYMQTISDEAKYAEYAAACEKAGITAEQAFAQIRARYDFDTLETMLTCSEARGILDANR